MVRVHSLLAGGLLVIIFSSFVCAQSFDIAGRVVSKKGIPVTGAHLYISENKWAVSDEDGTFRIKNVKKGTHELRVSCVGFNATTIPISVPNSTLSNLTIELTEKMYHTEGTVVVTASRTHKELEDVSVPVSVIDQTEIERSGSLRLNTLLEEQLGMQIVSDHGTGIQVQGFDPEYTLILIDDQPVIGRSAGTLDLSRLSVGNIEQIEIVKGPSSALWGSSALAGVINIITEKGSKPLSLELEGQYGTHNTYDVASHLTFKTQKLRGRFFGNINSSDGYDLNTNTSYPTIPFYTNYTFTGGLDYRLNNNIQVNLNARFYHEDMYSSYEVLVDDVITPNTDDATQYDYSLTPGITVNLGNRHLMEATAFFSLYSNKYQSYYTESGEVYFSDDFEQILNKYEIKSSTFWSDKHSTVFGMGLNQEDLTAEIYAQIAPFNSYFVYGQHEVLPFDDRLSITMGFRFDDHSKYKSQLSPKFSTLFKVSNTFKIRASFGGGFKAPDYRQLFLSFTNPAAGYSVFGSTQVLDGLARLQENGEIYELYVNQNDLKELTSENSLAYNAGFDWFPVSGAKLTVNTFRNNVHNLIETQRIALKTNGQSVFAYFNFDNVYTQGLEVQLSYAPSAGKRFSATAGYQYLDARKEITRTFDSVENGQVVRKTVKEFIPLYNRSRHSGNLKLNYVLPEWNVSTSLRFSVRGKFWFYDYNENNRVDENEYALEAHSLKDFWKKTLVNYSVEKKLYDQFNLQLGIHNLFNYRNEVILPSNPGRTFYLRLNIQIK